VASYQQTIELVLRGEEQLKKLQNRVTALNKEVEKLQKPTVKAGTGVLADIAKEATVEQKKYNNETGKTLLNQIKLNSAVDLYQRRLKAVYTTAAPSQKQFQGRLDEISQAFSIFKDQKNVAGVQAVSTELGRIIEYSNEINRSDVARAKSAQRLQGYIAEINRLKAAGINVSKAENTLEKVKTDLGTNRFRQAGALEVALKSRLKLLKEEEQQLRKNQKEAEKRTKSASAGRGKMAENLMLGAGFPLLFGGGAGQVIGGAVGGAVGGFAGSIVGSAIAQQIEDATRRVAELGNALKQLDVDALRDSFLLVNAELEQTVNHLIRAGNAQAAFEVASREAALQTGLLPEATQDITNNVNVLSNVWDETVGTVSSLLAILGAPFVSALAGVLKFVNLVAKGLNIIFSLTGSLLKRITEGIANSFGLQRVLQAIEYIMKATNEEQERGLAASARKGEQLEGELRKNQQLFEFEKKRTLGRTAAEKEINAEIDRAKALKTVDLELEKQIKAKREEFGAAVSHAAQVERDYQIILLQKAAELEKSKINQNHQLTQQNIELEKIKEKYVDMNEQLRVREDALKAEIKIFNLQKSNLDGIIELERSRNEVTSARLDLEESRLERQLDQLNSVNGSHIIRGQIIDEIAQRQIRQARIEHQNNIISIDQSVTKAELARKQVDFEVKSIQLQVESLKLDAQRIKDLGLRQSALQRIYAQEQSILNVANEMIAAADQQLATTRQIAQNQKLAAGYALQGKIEAIEASAAEQKRAAFLARSVSAQKELLRAAAATQSVQSTASSKAKKKSGKTTVLSQDEGYERGKLGATRTSSVTTSMPIDPDIKERVQSRGSFKSVEEMVGALEKAQQERNRQTIVQERRSASASTTANAMIRYSPSGGGQGSSSVNPTVNVTTGPVMNMDGQNYVNQNDFVAGLQSASTQGAEMALKMITSSGGARRDLGVG